MKRSASAETMVGSAKRVWFEVGEGFAEEREAMAAWGEGGEWADLANFTHGARVSCPDFLLCDLFTRDSSKSWRSAGSGGSTLLTTKEPSANIVLLDYISTEKWNEVVDFDDHLDDISKDWLNPNLFK